MKEFITIDGKQFILTADIPLTAEQKTQTITEIRRQSCECILGTDIETRGYDNIQKQSATTWTVNNGESIQNAINSAQTGDTINVYSGTYGPISLNKNVNLIGIDDGSGKPIITTPSSMSAGVIKGFKLTGGETGTAGQNNRWAFDVSGSGGIIDGNEFTGISWSACQFNAIIHLRYATGYTIKNNIIKDQSSTGTNACPWNASPTELIAIAQDYGTSGNIAYNNYIEGDYIDSRQNGGGDQTVYPMTLSITPILGTNIIGGQYIGGNYWKWYSSSSVDINGDGIGDTPIQFASGCDGRGHCYGPQAPSYDYYPLMGVPTTITILPVSIMEGETQQIIATVTDQLNNIMDIPVTWSSSNPSVGTIDNTGLFTAISAGITTITASAGSLSTMAIATVISRPYLVRISVSPSDSIVEANQSLQFSASSFDQFGNSYPTIFNWANSNPSVGTIDNTGLFTGISAGITTITASSGSVSASAMVTVILVPTTLAIEPSTATVIIGETVQFSATVYDQLGNPMPYAPITWGTSNASGSIDGNGLFTGVYAGTTTVTASSGGKSVTATVTTSTPNPKILSIYNSYTQDNSTYLQVGVDKPTVVFSVTSDQNVDWYWTENGVAMMSQYGTGFSSSFAEQFSGGNYIIQAYGINENGDSDLITWNILSDKAYNINEVYKGNPDALKQAQANLKDALAFYQQQTKFLADYKKTQNFALQQYKNQMMLQYKVQFETCNASANAETDKQVRNAAKKVCGDTYNAQKKALEEYVKSQKDILKGLTVLGDNATVESGTIGMIIIAGLAIGVIYMATRKKEKK